MRTFRIVNVDTHFLVRAADIPTATAKVKAHYKYNPAGSALTVSSHGVTPEQKAAAVADLAARSGLAEEVEFKEFTRTLQTADLPCGAGMHIKDVLLGAAAHVTLYDTQGATVETVTINKALFDHWSANCANYVIIEDA